MTPTDLQVAFEQHKDAVYRFAWRMTSADAAEDITQEVFLALLRTHERFDPARGPLRAFLLGIARNLALQRWRIERRWAALDEETLVAPPVDPDRGETAELVVQAVRSLPPLQREVLILAEYEDLSLADIARAVDAEIGTVKSRLHRARENLRYALAPLRGRLTPREPSIVAGRGRHGAA